MIVKCSVSYLTLFLEFVAKFACSFTKDEKEKCEEENEEENAKNDIDDVFIYRLDSEEKNCQSQFEKSHMCLR